MNCSHHGQVNGVNSRFAWWHYCHNCEEKQEEILNIKNQRVKIQSKIQKWGPGVPHAFFAKTRVGASKSWVKKRFWDSEGLPA
jgi:hypothetical protein